MKKTLIALAVLGATAGVAHAQSNVTIYGIVDTGYVKESGQTAYMSENINNRLGFRGVEDLGGGMKATFELEQRFDLFNGRNRNVDNDLDASSGAAGGPNQNARRAFDGAANVGLASKMGAVRFGRVNEISTETLRQFDPFVQYGVTGMLQSNLREVRISNTARYDSPNFAGFNVKGSFSLKNDADVGITAPTVGTAGTPGIANNGWAVNGNYANGPIAATVNYNKARNSADSYNWNVAGGYAFGPARITALYEKTNDKADGYIQKDWLIGATYKVGAGVIQASYGQDKINELDSTDKKFSLGYTHNLSKRTALYALYSRTEWDANSPVAGYYSGTADLTTDKVNAYQIGMTHKF